MVKDKKEFFKEKKPWSHVKDDLLSSYLRVYFQKVLTTMKPVRYIDCFAGAGKFEDGKPGSPLIALAAACESIRQGRTPNTDIELVFVEPVHVQGLQENVAAAALNMTPPIRYKVMEGLFEENVHPLVTSMSDENVFLYIDPYGVKDLDFGLVTSFADQRLNLRSIELLINFNSFGFLRIGFQVMGVKYQDDAVFMEDAEEFAEPVDIGTEDAKVRLGQLLDKVAGGEYWRDIVKDYQQRRIDGATAERRFSELYCSRLRKTYRYVLSMPIRKAEGHRPIYRMIHATQHPDGCVLMADNMMKRTENLYIHIKSFAQGMLFAQDLEGEVTDPACVEEHMKEVVGRLHEFTTPQEVIADFYVSQGVICKSAVIREAWARMEASGIIEVKRDPPTTDKGKKSTFFTTTKYNKCFIRAKQS